MKNQQVKNQEHEIHTYELEMTFPSVQIRLDDEAMHRHMHRHIKQEEIEKKSNNFLRLTL